MTKFVIAQEVVWHYEYDVEANDEAEAIEMIRNGEVESVSEGIAGEPEFKVISSQPTVRQATLG